MVKSFSWTSGMYLEGFVSSCSKNTPSSVIFPNTYYKYSSMKFKCFIEINIIGLISPALNLHNNNSIYLTCLSAEQDTPIPTGHEAPWRGNRITLTSWQKYLPPNCAPIPNLCVSWWIFCSISKSRNPLPCSFPYKNVFFSTYAFREIEA